MIYKCLSCNYETSVKCNFLKHNQTSKHLKKSQGSVGAIPQIKEGPVRAPKVPPVYEKVTSPSDPGIEEDIPITAKPDTQKHRCRHCGAVFAKPGNLKRHIVDRCPNKDSDLDKALKRAEELESRLKDKEIQRLMEKNNDLIEQGKKQDQENKYLKSMVEQAGSIVKTSVNALSYIHTNYKNAPLLEPINDYSIIKRNNETQTIENILMYYHTNGKLVEHLGNILVAQYKKENPSEQSIWNSDCARLSYIIRKLVDNKPDWITDKKGYKLRESVIDPLLDYLKVIVQQYVLGEAGNPSALTNDHLRGHLAKMEACNTLVADIDDGTIADNLVRYLAPHFYINK